MNIDSLIQKEINRSYNQCAFLRNLTSNFFLNHHLLTECEWNHLDSTNQPKQSHGGVKCYTKWSQVYSYVGVKILRKTQLFLLHEEQKAQTMIKLYNNYRTKSLTWSSDHHMDDGLDPTTTIIITTHLCSTSPPCVPRRGSPSLKDSFLHNNHYHMCVFLSYYMFLNMFKKKKYRLYYFESLVGFRISELPHRRKI